MIGFVRLALLGSNEPVEVPTAYFYLCILSSILNKELTSLHSHIASL